MATTRVSICLPLKPCMVEGRTPSCWVELSERKIVGQYFMRETKEKVVVIHHHLKATQDQQNSYADLKRREISFEVEDKVFLKLFPWKRIICFGPKGKLSPRFIKPYVIFDKVGLVAYRLALPPELSRIHVVFQVLILHRYISNPEYLIQIEELDIEPNLSYEEESVRILAKEVKELRTKRIPLMKVLWRNHNTEEAT
ncbi:uncharacterized protein LOC105762107 [Gossypium raimondii]|uniref:uncharacterized protein LOC105762107 n=1 Tax=Gossypium raimondii TaxID=29730 RepID=UPI00063AEC9C|nr:uncharacterized protein LOC105762107 [Gossypium raimondii]